MRRKRFAILRGELKGGAEIKAILTRRRNAFPDWSEKVKMIIAEGAHMEGVSPARRLAAIVCMDVASYSRLMGGDEEGTLMRIKAIQHGVIEPALAAHRGRLVKTTGDGFLAEFASVVDAVRSAAAIQQQAIDRAGAEPEVLRIALRIGINLGDVIAEGGDLHGDGVNVAARLEALAEPGTICLSGAAYEQVRDRIELAFEDMGEQALKNIARPVRVWRARMGVSEAPVLGSSLPLPDKPSIAVLPFANLSNDPNQEYFADGVVEDIINALSHFPRLFVIARNSSFTYKGRPGIDIRQVGRELGVRYVLEGSVRRAGERVRIAAQLIDADSGAHFWADRFDGVLADVFDLQDSLARSVVGAIGPRLMSAEVERAQRKRAASLDAYDLYLRALPNVYAMTRRGQRCRLGAARAGAGNRSGLRHRGGRRELVPRATRSAALADRSGGREARRDRPRAPRDRHGSERPRRPCHGRVRDRVSRRRDERRSHRYRTRDRTQPEQHAGADPRRLGVRVSRRGGGGGHDVRASDAAEPARSDGVSHLCGLVVRVFAAGALRGHGTVGATDPGREP